MHLDDFSADMSGLRIPRDVVADLELAGHDRFRRLVISFPVALMPTSVY
jgi:hypothetical protein